MTGLPDLIKSYLGGHGELTERRVLSGDGFFVDGRLMAAVIEEDLCVHVGGDRWDSALAMPGVSPLTVAGRAVPGWVLVDEASVPDEQTLAAWIENAVES